MPHILLVDANWDDVTKYLYSFRKHLLSKYLTQPGFSFRWLKDKEAVRVTVDGYLASNQVHYVSGAGHGLDDLFKGYSDLTIWEIGMKFPNLRNTIVHLLSCKTGASLGRELVAQGAIAFWGYNEDFRFLRKKPSPADLHTDSSAEWGLTMDCLIDIGILQGLAADDVYEQVWNYVEQETAGLGPFEMKRVIMHHNRRHLVCPATYWGDRRARLF